MWETRIFTESSYLYELSFEADVELVVVYSKLSNIDNPFKARDVGDLSIGFRFVQTYRNVPNSK
ncbi:hypothetical protein ACFLQ3_03215 [Bacteroidota bacterium]